MSPLNFLNLRAHRLLSALVLLAWLGGAGPAQAQARYSTSSDGSEVTDTQTGLVWRRCSQGQSWSGTTCTGTASTHTHEQALALAKTQTGWRLPNVKELSSLVDASRTNPSIDTTAFPNTPSDWFWSSTPYAGNSSNAWFVYFYIGVVSYDYRDYGFHVRLVR